MGPRLLCFVGGAALAAFFVLLGLLATPFFGSGAFLWANIFACFLLAMALGHGLGDLIVSFAGERLKKTAPAVAVLSGALAWLAAYLLPWICRQVLSYDADWTLAPAAAIAAVSLVPGAMIAAIVPCELRSRLEESDNARTGARVALRLMGLMTLGGIGGVLTAKPVLRADEVDVWVYAYGTGGLLVLLGAAFLPNVARAGCVLLLVALSILTGMRPSEIQTEQYAVALQTAWKDSKGAGLYYRWTSSDDLSEDELAELARQEGGTKKTGLILTLEFLERIGAGRIDGPGLKRCVDLFLSPEGRPFILPFFEQIKQVRSDGQGLLYIELKKSPGKIGREFEIPGAEPGEVVKFWFKSDFTIRLVHKGIHWRMEFGPLTREEAGLLEFNDSLFTPIRVLNVALWVDASVLALTVDDLPDSTVLKAEAQGDIGDVKSVEIYAAPKEE